MWRGKFDRSMTWFLRAGRHDVRANASRKMGAQVFFNAWERLWVPTCTSRGATFTSALAIRPGTSPLLFAIASIGKRHHALMKAIASGHSNVRISKLAETGVNRARHHHHRFALLEKLAQASQEIARQMRTYPQIRTDTMATASRGDRPDRPDGKPYRPAGLSGASRLALCPVEAERLSL